jgi:hypothetical protein
MYGKISMPSLLLQRYSDFDWLTFTSIRITCSFYQISWNFWHPLPQCAAEDINQSVLIEARDAVYIYYSIILSTNARYYICK